MRIELKNITPPEEIRLTMEKQMTTERTRRASSPAEGESRRRSSAEGQKQSQIVNAEGARRKRPSCAAEGQAQAHPRGAGRGAGDSGRLAGARLRRRPAQCLIARSIWRARPDLDQRAEAGVPP
jgi:regulator of protease activity HflC (stomatin/prohibitin superfamily)